MWRRTIKAGGMVLLMCTLGGLFWLETLEVPTQSSGTRLATRPLGSVAGPVQAGEPAQAGGSGPGASRAAPLGSGVEVRERALIDRVELEPQAPCVGETVTVTTFLKPDAVGAKVFVNGRPGTTQLVRVQKQGSQVLQVLARAWGDAYDLQSVVLQAHECEADPARWDLAIRARVLGAGHYLFQLQGDSVERLGEVRWNFGDGHAQTGSGLEGVSHRYRGSVMRAHSTYKVTADYRSPSGVERAALVVTHMEAAGVAYRTPFPTLGSQGARFVPWDRAMGLQTARVLTNDLPERVDFEVAELRGFPCDGSATQTRQVPAGKVLDRTGLPAGTSQEVSVHIGAGAFTRPICQLLVRLAGFSGERLATSAFALDTGLPDERMPVEDPATLRVLAAIVQERQDRTRPITPEDVALFRARQVGITD